MLGLNLNIWRVRNIVILVQFTLNLEVVDVCVVDYLCVTRKEIIMK